MSASASGATWHTKARSLELRKHPFINGKSTPSAASSTFSSVNPANGHVLQEFAVGDTRDVDFAVAIARQTFVEGVWADMPPLQRKIKLLRVAELIEKNADELALLDSLEMGKAITSARNEIAFPIGFFRYFGEAIDKRYGSVTPSDRSTIGLNLLEPRGVVGAIVPWNFPLINAALKAAPALAAGNSVVLKPSEITSLSALRLAELVHEAGVPAGVFNVVPGLGATIGDAMARHCDIDFLSFTGSTATGRKIMVSAGQSNGKPLMLECGGKSPQIVCADLRGDIEAVAARVVHDAFWNQGQWCSARSRLFVEASLYDELVGAVAAAASKLKPGDPLDPGANFGTIASTAQHQRVQSFIDDALSKGAKLVNTPTKELPTPLSIGPHIFAEVEPSIGIACEEVFGPVLTVTRFSDFEEAIAAANNTPYGLGATLWTRDHRRSQLAVRKLRAGKVIIRSSPTSGEHSGFSLGAEPWGASGFGVENGLEGLRSYSRIKAIEFIA